MGVAPTQLNQPPLQLQTNVPPVTNNNNNYNQNNTPQLGLPQQPPLMNFNRGGPPISQPGPPLANNNNNNNKTPLANGPQMTATSSFNQPLNRLPPPPPPTMNQGPPIMNFQNNIGSQMQQQNYQPNFNRPPGPPTTNQGMSNINYSQNNGPPLQPLTSQQTFNRPPFNGPPTSVNHQGPMTSSSQPPINQLNKLSISQQPQAQLQQQSPINYQQPPPQQQQQQQPQMTGSAQSNRNQPNAMDLLREKRLIQPYSEESEQPARPIFPHEFYTQVNCHADTIRCTLTAIPETQSLLSKLRLPLGILIHPFKDLESLKVVQSATIVRCRSCRSYINPFVHFLDNSKWRCNMCYSINDLPDEFLFDPVTRSYGDPSKRPEINSATIEFIAPPEYTVGHIEIFKEGYRITAFLVPLQN